jgi:hypothetical protein
MRRLLTFTADLIAAMANAIQIAVGYAIGLAAMIYAVGALFTGLLALSKPDVLLRSGNARFALIMLGGFPLFVLAVYVFDQARKNLER